MNYMIEKSRLRLAGPNFRFFRKLLVAVAGGGVMLAGLAMVVLPGPAILVIPLGLAILATEFLWARRAWLRTRSVLERRGKTWGLNENNR